MAFVLTILIMLHRDIHVVSLVHALIIVTLASRALNRPGLVADPTYGSDTIAELTHSIAVGYVPPSLLPFSPLSPFSSNPSTLQDLHDAGGPRVTCSE